MPGGEAKTNAAGSNRDVRALLKVSTGSRLVPIVMLLVSAIAFAAYWLPDGRAQITSEFDRVCKSVRFGSSLEPGVGTRPGVVGLALRDVSPSRKPATQAPKGAVVLAQPQPRGWGETLKGGDLVVKVNDVAVETATAAAAAIAAAPKGAAVKLTIRRGIVTPGGTASGDSSAFEAAETTLDILPPVAAKPVTGATGVWRNGPQNYRDWCVSRDGPDFAEIKADFAKRPNIWAENPLQSFAPDELGGAKDTIRSLASYAKLFLEDVTAAIGSYWTTALAIVGSAAAFALLPGLAGLVYRRAFWTWFAVAFAGFLAIRSVFANVGQVLSTQHGDGGDDSAQALAAGIVVFVLAQVAVLLFTQRLRRHTTKPALLATLIPENIYNRALQGALVILGAGMAILGWGGDLLATLPLDPFWTKWNLILLGLPFLYYLLKISPSWQHRGAKNIVVCLDGTSNTPDQLDLGLSAQTNVFKLFSMLQSDPGGSFAPAGRFDATLCKTLGDKQVALYYTGIGNKYDNDPLLGTLSQATGLGAAGVIERAYLDIIRVWRPGDRVFIFGFSRGAASARILSRVIDQRKAPRSIWSLRLLGRHWTLWPSGATLPVPITVLCCWDTVASFGVAKTIAGINFQQLSVFYDLTVPENVEQVYHLVALDEDRQEFEPTLMDPDPIRPERIVEVWFAGTHAGVGGGWATDRLSDVALDFVLRRVSSGYCADGSRAPGDPSWGLYLNAANGMNQAAAALATGKPETSVIYPDPLGQLRTFISGIYNYRPRKLPLHAVISDTVFERMTRSLPVYAPQALFDLNDALDAKRDLIREKVAKLEETNSMVEQERAKVLEFTDKLRLSRFSTYWGDVVATRDGRRPDGSSSDPGEALSNVKLDHAVATSASVR